MQFLSLALIWPMFFFCEVREPVCIMLTIFFVTGNKMSKAVEAAHTEDSLEHGSDADGEEKRTIHYLLNSYVDGFHLLIVNMIHLIRNLQASLYVDGYASSATPGNAENLSGHCTRPCYRIEEYSTCTPRAGSKILRRCKWWWWFSWIYLNTLFLSGVSIGEEVSGTVPAIAW